MRFNVLFGLAVASVALLAGCSGKDGQNSATGQPQISKEALASATKADPEAERFLKWSMDQHKALKSYVATVVWHTQVTGKPEMAQTRSISYAAPNKFRVESDLPDIKFLAVSDGKQLVESNNKDLTVSYSAPDRLSNCGSQLFNNPLLCGSLLYQFFGGSQNYEYLVNESDLSGVTFGETEKLPNGEEAKTVRFVSPTNYGHVEALIGTKTGLVYRISSDMAGVAAQMQGTTISAVEKIDVKSINAALTADRFKPNSLNKTPAKPGGWSQAQKPPVAKGAVVPDFDVTDLQGKQVKLSQMRGKVVLLDFWATWCGPCREGLKHTEELRKEFGDKVAVMAVSDEKPNTVKDFLKANAYDLPFYVDPTGTVNKLFRTISIPTQVVVDKDGRLVEYLVGLRPDDVKAAIEQALS